MKAIIMAGGKGTRLSPEKPLLEVCGTPMILRVYSFARSLTDEVYVATIRGHIVDEKLGRLLKIVYTDGRGYEEDVVQAVRTVGFPTLVLPSDTPFLSWDDVKPLFECKSSVCTLLSRGRFVGVSLWRSDNLKDYSSVEVEKEVINVNTPDDLTKANILCKERIL
ncbi:MAG: NTP transferase domain-containing protein [Candidatus Aramenus sp.]|nr:NTP transferase domain-containing protein [Candidatus Aramenus sp.]